MSDLLEQLKQLEYGLEKKGYEIDHYEVRNSEPEPGSGGMNGRNLQRAEGVDPLKTATEWDSIDSEEYVIEVFMGGETPLDRIMYDPGEELEAISFSGRSYDLDIEDILEE